MDSNFPQSIQNSVLKDPHQPKLGVIIQSTNSYVERFQDVAGEVLTLECGGSEGIAREGRHRDSMKWCSEMVHWRLLEVGKTSIRLFSFLMLDAVMKILVNSIRREC
jgi:hypothetical protein